ncbi:DUF3618 domain-containing protein [Allokutzneria sp. A3M-2-11 16]|uniref:DUF3618 domain-containing protein n=1 Tax=Allokutzneria sp. A3M-2-11 16 TaxID=2962043 RepID=UPI0020B73594|nr:DUF3618 domain-containing protein [Allokutzneria sp. A3M-2-11 16]MCP3802463.1 DUF3618 domain-containing protein [Allokutzneria sp. A3M-2-11 16]
MTTKRTNDGVDVIGSAEPQQDNEKMSPEELREDILHTRAQLAGTVDALSYKLDVKARTKEKAEQLREKAQLAVGHAVDWARTVDRKKAATTVGGVAAGVLVLRLMKRRKDK